MDVRIRPVACPLHVHSRMRTQPGRPVIILEFNELTPTLIHEFMAAGKLPNFRRIHAESHVYITDAQEEQKNLEPWIQWVTVHTGLSFAEHGLSELNQGHRLNQKCIWDLASDAGLRVWVCGSMNTRYDLPLNGCVLPDPWTTAIPPYPPELLPYVRFVQSNVQEHTRDRVALSGKAYLEFLGFMVRHGLSASTAGAIVRQLVRERLGHGRWQRPAILDKLQWDVFRSYYRRMRPHLSTFFVNSTAHLQHMYWRNMDPGAFEIQPSEKEQEELAGAVLYGYQEMDALLGRFLRLAGRDATLVLCTALGQQPCLIYESKGGKTFYRPNDFKSLLEFAGVTADVEMSPLMSEEFQVICKDEAAAREVERGLAQLQVDGTPALRVERIGATLRSGCSIFRQLPREAVLRIENSDRVSPFYDLFYQGAGLKSGMHHPDGFCWIRTPDRTQSVAVDRVPLRAVAPTVLQLLGVPIPAGMTAEPLLGERPLGAPRSPRSPGPQGPVRRVASMA